MARYRQSGPTGFGEIAEFFGGTSGSAFSLNDHYRGGGIVPSQGPNGGRAAVYQIDVDPDASSGDTGTGVNEEFYIYLTGESSVDLDVPNNWRVTTYTPNNIPVDSFAVTSFTNSVRTNGVWPGNAALQGSGTFVIGNDAYEVLRDAVVDGDIFEVRLSSDNTVVFSGTVSDSGVRIIGRLEMPTIDVNTVTVREGDAPLDDTDYTFHIIRGDSATVRIEIPTNSIDETFTIARNLTTDVDLRNDLLTIVQANTAITNNWNVSAQNRTITRNTFVDTGFTVNGSGVRTDGTFTVTFRTTNANVADDSNFAIGNTLLVGHNLYEIISIARTFISSISQFEYFVTTNRLRSGDTSFFDDPIFAMTGTEEVEVPVVEFISQDTTNHAVMVGFDAPAGDLSNSQVHLESDGPTGVPSEVRIDFGTDINPQTLMLILGANDSDGIADLIAQSIEGQGQLYTSRDVSSSVRIEDSLQRDRTTPTIEVTTTGSSGLVRSDFILTTVQAGAPTERMVGQTLLYSTDDSLDLNDQWGFFTNAGVNSNPTSWPTGNGIFLRINDGEFITNQFFDTTLQTTLGLARQPDETLQAVDSTTLLITAGPVSVGSTEFNQAQYNVVGIRTVSATNLDLIITLDEINSALLENNVPLDNDLAGLTFIRRPFGDINTDIPEDTRVLDNPTILYSTGDVPGDTTGWSFSSQFADMQTETFWPNAGEFYIRIGTSEFTNFELSERLGLGQLLRFNQAVTGSTLTFNYDVMGTAATSTYIITGALLSDRNPTDVYLIRLQGLVNHSLANTNPQFTDGQVVGLTFNRPTAPLTPISFSNFYNANDGGTT